MRFLPRREQCQNYAKLIFCFVFFSKNISTFFHGNLEKSNSAIQFKVFREDVTKS